MGFSAISYLSYLVLQGLSKDYVYLGIEGRGRYAPREIFPFN